MIIFKYGSSMQRDPYIIYHNSYYYYVCASEGCKVLIAKLKDVKDLQNASFVEVFKAPENTMYSKELWAPELHIIDNKCYIYVALDDGLNDNHRMYVLKNDSDDPLKPYVLHGKISDDSDCWAIDGSIFSYQDQLYFIWSGWETSQNVMQEIYIAKMKDPFTIDSKRVSISKPELDFELNGGIPLVNEGPIALKHGNDLFIAYSASGCWTNYYCVGLLKLVGNDLLDKSSWQKESRPLLEASESLKGPGHNCFININGVDYIVFHAYHDDCSKGGYNVDVHIKEIYWVDGLPKVNYES